MAAELYTCKVQSSFFILIKMLNSILDKCVQALLAFGILDVGKNVK